MQWAGTRMEGQHSKEGRRQQNDDDVYLCSVERVRLCAGERVVGCVKSAVRGVEEEEVRDEWRGDRGKWEERKRGRAEVCSLQLCYLLLSSYY